MKVVALRDVAEIAVQHNVAQVAVATIALDVIMGAIQVVIKPTTPGINTATREITLTDS